MVSFSETKIIPKPKKAVFNAVKEALQSIGADIRTVNEKKGIIGAGVGVQVWSWGENIAIKVVAEGEERDLMKFANKLERESNSREIENFYTKWAEPNKDLESFYVVTNQKHKIYAKESFNIWNYRSRWSLSGKTFNRQRLQSIWNIQTVINT